ncbi:MAG: electron transporter RnfD [Coprococcus sp.]
MKIMPDDKRLTYSGRIDWSNPKAPVFVFPCTSVKMKFTGERIKIFVKNKNAYWDNYLGCILDGIQTMVALPKEGEVVLDIPVSQTDQQIHDVLLFKRQDACHEMAFLGAEIGENERLLPAEEKNNRRIEVYGDSVSAGEVSEAVDYTGKEDPEHNGEYSNTWFCYAWMTARKLNAEIHDIAQGGIALMDETGWFCEPDAVGMETAWDKIHYNPLLGSSSRWNFDGYTPQVVIVAIGQNDSHPMDYMQTDYNGAMAEKWRQHYKSFLERLRQKYPKACIVCCTTLLMHDASWDRSIGQIVEEMKDEKITQYLFKRNGTGTPGHLRIPEAEEMACELAAYIETLEIDGWN